MKRFLLLPLLALSLQATAQLNATLRSNLDFGTGVNDIWGYTAPDGTEYALMGLDTGVAIISLADPDRPLTIGVAGSTRSIWRDIKTYGEFAYVTADQGAVGLTVIDLRQLPESFSDTSYHYDVPGYSKPFVRAHNIYVDTVAGLAFTAGGDRAVNDGGILIFDVAANPAHPPLVAAGPEIYSHDVYVRDSFMYASEIYQGEIAIYNIANLDSIFEVGRNVTPFRFTHNSWLSDDGNTLFTTDERGNASVAAFDISDPGNMQLIDEYRPLTSLNSETIPHNVHVIGDYLSISYYTDGLRVVDAADPANLVEVAHYDTWSGADGGFNGNWGAYPFLPSGLTLVSDRATGLYVIDVDYQPAARLAGTVVDAGSGLALNRASVEILTEQLNATLTDALGTFATGIAEGGDYLVAISADGYTPDTASVMLVNGETVLTTFALTDTATTATSVTIIEPVDIRATIAPNPASGPFTLDYDLRAVREASLEVFSMDGKLEISRYLGEGSGRSIFGQDLRPGVYFARISSAGQSLRTYKIVRF